MRLGMCMMLSCVSAYLLLPSPEAEMLRISDLTDDVVVSSLT